MSVSYQPLSTTDPVNGVGIAPTNTNGLSAKPSATAPMARTEIDDDLDDRETVSTPYPGVDDGFFSNGDKDKKPDVETLNPDRPKKPGPDVEIIPSKPKDPEPIEPPSDEVPEITPRNGGGSTDDLDGKDPNVLNIPNNRPVSPAGRRPSFPYAPGYGFPYGHDLEVGSIPGDPESSIPDVNVYQHKKTLAQGMMDLALFSANANQLRYVLEINRHPYYLASLVLISVSLILQVAVGIGLIWNATYNVKDKKEICVANRINNFTVIGIFLVTVINVFISAFGVSTTTS